jgi:hypothetical protein
MVTILIVIFGIFVGIGYLLAPGFSKDPDKRLGVGLLIGIGLMFVAAAIIYAGCSASMRNF